MLDFIDLTLTLFFFFFHFDSLTHDRYDGIKNATRKWKPFKYFFLTQRIGGNGRISQQKTEKSGRGQATGSKVNCQMTSRAGQLSGPLGRPFRPSWTKWRLRVLTWFRQELVWDRRSDSRSHSRETSRPWKVSQAESSVDEIMEGWRMLITGAFADLQLIFHAKQLDCT